MLKFMAGLAKQGLSQEEIVEHTVEYKTQLEKKYKEGRDAWGSDFDDTARDALRIAGITSGAAKGLSLALAAKSPPLAAAGLLLSEATDVLKDMGENALDLTPVQDLVREQRNLFSTYATYDLVDEYNKTGSSMIKDFHDQCLEDEACQKAAAIVFPNLAAAGSDKVDVRPGAVINANPDVFNELLQISVQTDLTVIVDLDELKDSLISEYQDNTKILHEDMVAVQEELQALKIEQTNLVTWLKNKSAQEEALKRQAALEAEIQQRWANVQKGIEVASIVVGLFDKKLGSDIQRVGTAGLAVVKAGVAMVKAASALSEGFKVATALGSAAATGNFIGAAVALIGAFGPSGPTPEQMILDEIKALREDMQQLHTDMTQRFDRIDESLNKIYVDVLSKLDEIDVAVGQVNRRVETVLDELDAIQAELYRQQALIIDFFQQTHRQELQTTFVQALGRPKSAVNPLMTPAEFQSYEGTFRAWATVHCAKDIEVPVNSKSVADADLHNELKGLPLENVAYLNKVVAEKGWPAFAPTGQTERLVNAHTWMIAACGYSQLEGEWTALAAQTTSAAPNARRDEVAAPGHAILSALRQIPKRDSGNLLERAVENLENKYLLYEQQIQAAEDQWEAGDVLPAILQVDPAAVRVPVFRADPRHDYGYVPRVYVWRGGAADPEPGFELAPRLVQNVPAVFRNATFTNSPPAKPVMRVTVTVREYEWGEWVTVPDHRPGIPRPIDPDEPPEPPKTKDVYIRHTGTEYTAQLTYQGQVIGAGSHDDDMGASFGEAWSKMRWHIKSEGDLDLTAALSDIDVSRRWLWKDHFYPTLWNKQLGYVTVNDPLRIAADELDGALRLVDCLLDLGLPTARVNDEMLVALLNGRPMWVDGVGLFGSREFLAHLDPAGDKPSPAPVDKGFVDYLNEVRQLPLQILAERVVAYQNALDAVEHQEFYRDIELTLSRLSLAGDLVDLARPGLSPVDP
ncbi:hypothetical protein [Kocuria sp. CH-021]|uniref:hypothetical protein n=1 Tax=Kocuria sp. CH-021 TaxID=3406735 RepID=UPI003C77C02C